MKDVTSTSALLIAEGERGAEFGSGLGYSYTFDNRVTGLNPKSSLLFRFGQDFVGLGIAIASGKVPLV